MVKSKSYRRHRSDIKIQPLEGGRLEIPEYGRERSRGFVIKRQVLKESSDIFVQVSAFVLSTSFKV